MIEVTDLTKKYGRLTALDGVTFSVGHLGICGFLGPNGAGKSTAMNILTGCIGADSGSVFIDGVDVVKNPLGAKKKIGYLPEIPPLYPDMTPSEYLGFVAEAKGVKNREEAVSEVLKITGTEGVKDRLIASLSKGFKQRVGIAEALIGDPELLVLDEPTVGLDPSQVVGIRELIRKIGKNRTVLLSSHVLSEVEELCDHVVIINEGRIVAQGSIEELQKEFTGTAVLKLTARCSVKKSKEILSHFDGIGNLTVTAADPNATLSDVRLEYQKQKDVREAIFFAFASAKCPILSMQTENATLEDIFLKAVAKREKTAAEPPKPKESPKKKNSLKDMLFDREDGEKQTKNDENDDGYRPLFR